MTLKLRNYQEECIETIQYYFDKGVNRQLVHLPTAAGKTVIFAHLIQHIQMKTLVLVHTNELLEQAKEKIQMICPSLDIGLVNASNKEFDKPVVISTIQSARQSENLKKLQLQCFKLLIYDEAHHSCADGTRLVVDALGFGKKAKHLLVGFSATPSRNDGRGLGEVFDNVVYHKSIKWMIEQGYLSPPKGIKIATDLDLSQIVIENGDFATTSLAKVMDTDVLNDLVVTTFLEKASNRKAICFGVNIEHSNRLTELFRARGLTSETISGIIPKEERERIITEFKEGKISVLNNCQVLTEGFDCPDVNCIILARPTRSPGLYQQMVGRGLRRHPNKNDCIILDFGDRNHSLCSTALLTGDSEAIEIVQQRDGAMVALAKSLPPTINQKLKKAIIEFNPLGDDFIWQKDGSGYFLKGVGNKILHITRVFEDRYSVFFINGSLSQSIASDVTFEYAFGIAEDFAKKNRSQFVVSDLDAAWRTLPISDRQKKLFRSYGYRSGIEDLSRGQAALIISSGVLNRKAAR